MEGEVWELWVGEVKGVRWGELWERAIRHAQGNGRVHIPPSFASSSPNGPLCVGQHWGMDEWQGGLREDTVISMRCWRKTVISPRDTEHWRKFEILPKYKSKI